MPAFDPLPFQSINDYVRPALPAEETLRLYLRRAKGFFRKANSAPFIADDKLQRTLTTLLDEIVGPPACGPLVEELDLTLRDWIADPSPTVPTRLIVLPPGDRNAVISAWAAEREHQVLEPPSREALIDSNPPIAPDLTGEGLLVIPDLARWFLRHRHGLKTIRQLLTAVHASPRHCLIGCTSWAWAFLIRAIGADLILPGALTFQPYNAVRLQRWFSELSTDPTTDRMTFRLSQNGADVLDVDANGQLRNDYLSKLAARSLGIPWVAWRLWRRSLRSDPETADEVGNQSSDPKLPADNPTPLGDRTLWVAQTEEYALPAQHHQLALLVLQALLIHGRLTVDELALVVPIVGDNFVAAALLSCGFIEQIDDELCVRAIAYPAARAELFSAGFPVASI